MAAGGTPSSADQRLGLCWAGGLLLQQFLTKGALFLLVVDLHAFSKEVQSGVNNFTDPHGRVYWWLEILHMRVPGAAVALVGSHVDDMERDGLDADEAARRLHAGEASCFFTGNRIVLFPFESCIRCWCESTYHDTVYQAVRAVCLDPVIHILPVAPVV